ncbi:MAG: efflux RND transporter permease subunit [Helicobacter sp.]|nr:efflux RND transporter permease subunit [Helicobacter sp.]
MYKIAIQRPITTMMLSLMVVFFGIFGWTKLKVALFPDIDFPVLFIQASYPSASPEIIETKVIDKIESAINGLDGIERIQSNSLKGFGYVIVQFNLDKNIDVALNEVNSKLAGLIFDDGVKTPIVRKFDSNSSPIVSLFVTNKNGNVKELMNQIDVVISPELQRITGVGGVDSIGFRERQIKVFVNQSAANKYNITYADIHAKLVQNNVQLGGGRIKTNGMDYQITIDGDAKSVNEIGDILITPNIRLRDVAQIKDELQDLSSFASYGDKNGLSNNGVIIEVKKIAKANEIEISNGVKEALKRLSAQFPDLDIKVFLDSTDYIRDSISDVQFDLVFGGILAVIVVFLFLRNVGMMVVSALALPVSLLGTLAIIQILGYTLNMLTLMALTLSIGIIIDDAIVVIENIHKKLESGESKMRASFLGVKEIAFTIVAISFMLLAVFVPIGNMTGIIGRFFESFGITIAIAIVVSYFVVLTLIPMASSLFISGKESKFARKTNFIFEALERYYVKILRLSLRNKSIVISLVILLLGGSSYVAYNLGSEFLLKEDTSQFNIYISAPPGISIDEMSTKIKALQEATSKDADVLYTTAQVGGGNGRSNRAKIYVRIKGIKDREGSQTEIMHKIQDNLRKLDAAKDLQVFASDINLISGGGGNSGGSFQMTIFAPTKEALDQSVANFQKFLQSNPILKDKTENFDSSTSEMSPEYRITINRLIASKYGVTPTAIARTIQNALSDSISAGAYKDNGREYDISIRVPDNERERIEQIKKLQVQNKFGKLMFLDGLISIKKTNSLSSIARFNRQRSADIYLSPKDDLKLSKLIEVTQKESASWLANGASFTLGGDSENTKEAAQVFGGAIAIAIVLIYLILAALYESVILPFIIMLTMPLSFMGAFFALKIAGQPFSIFSFMGLILLLGIVGKNATLLIDFANQRRKTTQITNQKEAIIDSIIYAGKSRLRPILMTTIAMVFGMLPLALSISAGQAMKNPIGISMIGGLLLSMILSLIVIPIFYVLLVRFDDKLRKFYEKPNKKELDNIS